MLRSSRDRHATGGGDRLEERGEIVRQVLEPAEDRGLDRAHGESPRGIDGSSARQAPPELDRVERVPAGDLVDPPEEGARDGVDHTGEDLPRLLQA